MQFYNFGKHIYVCLSIMASGRVDTAGDNQNAHVIISNSTCNTPRLYSQWLKNVLYIVQQFHWANKRDVTLRHLRRHLSHKAALDGIE